MKLFISIIADTLVARKKYVWNTHHGQIRALNSHRSSETEQTRRLYSAGARGGPGASYGRRRPPTPNPPHTPTLPSLSFFDTKTGSTFPTDRSVSPRAMSGSPARIVSPGRSLASSSASRSSSAGRKRRIASSFVSCRCSECGDVFPDYDTWYRHQARSPICSDAIPDSVDAREETVQDLNQATGASSHKTDLKEHCLSCYSNLQYGKLVPRTCIDEDIKEKLIEPLMGKLKAEVCRRLATSVQDRERIADVISDVFDIHRDIETTCKEEAALKHMIKPVKPVPRELIDQPNSEGKRTGPRCGDFVYDVPITEELEAMLKCDPSLLAQLQAASAAFASERPEAGACREVYVDITDGAVITNHPGIGICADRSDGRCASHCHPLRERL